MKKIILLIILMGLCVSVWGADSTKTRAELITDFADNESGSITPQDMRNLITSVEVTEESDSTAYRYLAYVSQTGTGNPSATVYATTFGTTPTWTRYDSGLFGCSLDSSYTASRVFVQITSAAAYQLLVPDTMSGAVVPMGNYDLEDMARSDTTAFWIEIKVKNP